MNTSFLNVMVPEDFLSKLRMIALKRKITLKKLVNDALSQLIQEEKINE